MPPDTLKVLQEFLQAAVPLWTMRFKELPWEDLKEVMKEAERVLEESGELAVFVTVKKGETAKIFNAVARAIAALSFVPGGIDIFGRHFETKYEGPMMGAKAKDSKDLRKRVICVDPWFVSPLHGITDDIHFRTIAQSMMEGGWRGRPLIVVPLGRGYYQAATGSHRHAAAIEASLPKIPVLPLNEAELAVVEKAEDGYDADNKRIYAPAAIAELLEASGHAAIGNLLRMDVLTSIMEMQGVPFPWSKEAQDWLKGRHPEALKVMAVEKWPCR